MFKRVLIANRGEIAVRIARTLREMGIEVLAVYSDADRSALHVRHADRACGIGPAAASESYLNIERVLGAAKRMQADAIHPGYGFLAENAAFARACLDQQIAFIGPPPAAIEAMGDKMIARDRMAAAEVPVVPGAQPEGGAYKDQAQALAAARKVGFPLMLKATAGGGGKGMRLVESEAEFAAALAGASREAEKAFGNGTVYIERFIRNPRHVEVQLVADGHGNVVHLFERDCSVQRRHQKVIEETPCPVLDDATRRRMGEIATRAARAVDYQGAGTVEFLYGGEGEFYFLEMNTRLQVEHPITELCTGVDLVRWQLLVADGQPLPLSQEQIVPRGAAIECRIYAEDPVMFLPSPGRLSVLREPSGPGVRVDSGVAQGDEISSNYDPMIAKLAVWASDRPQAIARMDRALSEYRLAGIEHNVDFHRRVLAHEAFISGNYDTGFIGAHRDALAPKDVDDPLARAAVAIDLCRRQTSARRDTDRATSSAWRQHGAWRRNG